jgi:hypothetical protein
MIAAQTVKEILDGGQVGVGQSGGGVRIEVLAGVQGDQAQDALMAGG